MQANTTVITATNRLYAFSWSLREETPTRDFLTCPQYIFQTSFQPFYSRSPVTPSGKIFTTP